VQPRSWKERSREVLADKRKKTRIRFMGLLRGGKKKTYQLTDFGKKKKDERKPGEKRRILRRGPGQG